MSEHSKGKKAQKLSEKILNKKGFVKAKTKTRRALYNAFKEIGIEIYSKAFDYLKKSELQSFEKTGDISNITLYELKTASKERKKKVSRYWIGFGFTLTEGERENAFLLGDQYKFIFLNLKNNRFTISSIDDWYTEDVSRIYPTESIFIKDDVR